MIDEPQNVIKQADSGIATRFASKILNQLLPVLGIFPDGDIDYLLPTQTPAQDTTGNADSNNQPDVNTGTEQGSENNSDGQAEDGNTT
jgi:stage V sporulation protein D (sporulation-specific penicillin-binding protein)